MEKEKKATEGDDKQKSNKRLAAMLEFGATIHSDVDKFWEFHLWDEEEKDALFEDISKTVKKAKKEVTQMLSAKEDLWKKTGSHATTWMKTTETGRPDKQGPPDKA